MSSGTGSAVVDPKTKSDSSDSSSCSFMYRHLYTYCVFAGKVMHQSADELITYFQSDLMYDFGFDDDYVIQSLVITMQELRRMKLARPPAPRPGDAVEKPTMPFGCFEPPTVERLIASMHVESTSGEFAARPSIPADGGPVIVPEALLKRNASDWSFLDRDNDEISSAHASVAATDCPSSRTSLVSSLLDNIGSLSTTNEPCVVSFTVAESSMSHGTMETNSRTRDADQISNSEYDNVRPSGSDEFSSIYEQELEQTLESIEHEIQELLGMCDKPSETNSSQVTHNDQVFSPSVVASTSVSKAQQQNHVIDLYARHSAHSESSATLDNVVINSSLTSDLHSSVAEHAAFLSPSIAASGAACSPPVMSWSDSNSCQPHQKLDADAVVIPIQHLPSSAPYRPPIKPKPQNVAVSSNATSPTSALTPIPVLHLRTVPMAQFSAMSSLSASNRPVPTSSTNGC